ncbi:C-C motif chemokine 20-like isoform X2 [Dendropsophus ebraccatus]|uniref:C-C motif chemokine 20-like isoform X2 n=1 Tax=Dendropsophus ebraccatus TaxID=150705 RepID=UPI003831045F
MAQMDQVPVKKISYVVAILGLLYCVMHGRDVSAGAFDCCYTYYRKTLPMVAIKSFTIQSSSEVCAIDAIIFITKKGRKVCTDPKEAWVRKAMRSLRKKKNKKN